MESDDPAVAAMHLAYAAIFDPSVYVRSSWRQTRCTDGDGDKGSQCGGRVYETTNFRAAPDGCYCRCIIGERTGDREEGECIIWISILPTTGSPTTSGLCMSSMGSP
eukprot:jgi/Tetstr1/458032/TSEL_044540.t1